MRFGIQAIFTTDTQHYIVHVPRSESLTRTCPKCVGEFHRWFVCRRLAEWLFYRADLIGRECVRVFRANITHSHHLCFCACDVSPNESSRISAESVDVFALNSICLRFECSVRNACFVWCACVWEIRKLSARFIIAPKERRVKCTTNTSRSFDVLLLYKVYLLTCFVCTNLHALFTIRDRI